MYSTCTIGKARLPPGLLKVALFTFISSGCIVKKRGLPVSGMAVLLAKINWWVMVAKRKFWKVTIAGLYDCCGECMWFVKIREMSLGRRFRGFFLASIAQTGYEQLKFFGFGDNLIYRSPTDELENVENQKIKIIPLNRVI